MSPEITTVSHQHQESVHYNVHDEKTDFEKSDHTVTISGVHDDHELKVNEVDEIINAEDDFSPEEYKKLVRKIDCYLLPLMWFCYGIQQSDKTGIASQALFGLRADTKLVGQQYAWLTTIFYLCYMFCEFPSNLLLQKLPLGKTLSFAVLFWGGIVLSTAGAKNWSQLMAIRALQGAFECCISPGFLLIISAWYQTHEQAGRALVFQAGNAGYGMIADLAAYGIGSHAQAHPGGLQPWRGISLFLGSGTILAAILCFIFIGTPGEVWWLNEREKAMATARIIRNKAGTAETGRRVWNWSQVKEALVDPPTWFAFLNVILVSIPNGGASTFGSLINASFGFTSLEVILYGLPRSCLSLAWFAFVGYCTTRRKNLRMWFMMFSSACGFAGMMVMGLLPLGTRWRWDKWGGYLLFTPFVISLFLGWSVIPSNTTGRTKKSVVSSITFVGYCVGNMIGSQVFTANQAPRYITGLVVCAACLGVDILIIGCWRYYYVWQNKKRDASALASGISKEEQEKIGKEMGGLDISDRNNPHFRYTL